jgi:PHD/YefM family antitoxin component YafN of YafNO toxin-antitoxin module
MLRCGGDAMGLVLGVSRQYFTKNGRPVAVLLSVGDDEDELERLLMAYSPKLRSILDAARERIRHGQGMPHEEFWAELREELRADSAT